MADPLRFIRSLSLSVTAARIRDTLDAYLASYPGETGELAPLRELLEAGADLTSRREFRGHVTAGAAVIGADGLVLLIHHRATGKWLIPGGHLDPGDGSLREAARRELAEETGIPAASVRSLGPDPIRISAHAIPARPAKDEPEHRHFDFKYCFATTADVGALQDEEIVGARWCEPGEIRDALLRERLPGLIREVRSAP